MKQSGGSEANGCRSKTELSTHPWTYGI